MKFIRKVTSLFSLLIIGMTLRIQADCTIIMSAPVPGNQYPATLNVQLDGNTGQATGTMTIPLDWIGDGGVVYKAPRVIPLSGQRTGFYSMQLDGVPGWMIAKLTMPNVRIQPGFAAGEALIYPDFTDTDIPPTLSFMGTVEDPNGECFSQNHNPIVIKKGRAGLPKP